MNISKVREAKVIKVIRVISCVGKGDSPDDPCRQLIEYFSEDGELLAAKYEWKERALTPRPEVVAGTGVMAVDFDKLVNQTDSPGTHH